MALSKDAYTALTRFGLGISPNDISSVEKNPKRWLQSQLKQGADYPETFLALPATSDIYATIQGKRKNVQAARKVKNEDTQKELRKNLKRSARDFLEDDIEERILHAATTSTPYIERLCLFWSNHFSVSARKKSVLPIACAFEREAIRPHVLKKFLDMLIASSQHPAMLLYLDNVRSYGPNSQLGISTGRGLNENLAREILELHTLGVEGGYDQNDVIGLAKIITGWSVYSENERHPGQFVFRRHAHEPGTHILLGKRYSEDTDNGVTQGIAALKSIARHNSTAFFISQKLVRHFTSDTPEKTNINRLANAFRSSSGDLLYISKKILDLKDAWSKENLKLKTPYELVIAALRLSNLNSAKLLKNQDALKKRVSQWLKLLEHAPFTAASPEGFPDIAEAWSGPEATIRRVEWAESASQFLSPAIPMEQLMAILGKNVSEKTKHAVLSASDNQEAFGIYLASPDFQWR